MTDPESSAEGNAKGSWVGEIGEWPESLSRARGVVPVIGVLLLVLLAVCTASFAIGALSNGVVAGGVFAAGLATMFGGGAVVGVEGKLRSRSGARKAYLATDGEPRLVLPYSKAMHWGQAAIPIGLAGGLAGSGVAQVAMKGGVDGGVVLALLLSIPFATYPLFMALGWIALGRVELSPSGLRQRGWSFDSRAPWDDIMGVQPGFSLGLSVDAWVSDVDWERRYTAPFWRQDKLPFAPRLEIPASNLAVDPGMALRLISHYVSTPEDIAELGTQASLDRARALV